MRCSAARDAGYGEQLAKVFMVAASLLTDSRAKLKRITASQSVNQYHSRIWRPVTNDAAHETRTSLLDQ